MPVRHEEEQEAARDRDGACTAPASEMPGMVSLAAWCLSMHGTPDIMVSRPAWCPARHSTAEVAVLQQGTHRYSHGRTVADKARLGPRRVEPPEPYGNKTRPPASPKRTSRSMPAE